MASSLIGSLRVALGLDTAQFEAGAVKAKAHAKSTAGAIESSFNSAKHAVEGLFAAFAVGALTEQIKHSLEYAGSLAEVAKTLGVTTKDLQTFRFAATQSGVAQDELEVGLRRLTVSMGKAELGSKQQAKAFQAIGISVDQLKGKTTGDVFRLMADGLSKVTDRSQRAAIEMTLMGRSGSTLDNLLAPGARRLNELAQAAQQLGIVLSDRQIQGAEETAHKLEAVKQVLSAQIAGVVADNASAILSLSSALATLTGQIVKFLGSNPQLALGIIGALAGARVGGVPGALIGGAAGALAGARIGQNSADANTDLRFREQQMFAARQKYLDAAAAGGNAGGPAMSVGGIQTAGGAGPSLRDLKGEWIKQIHLLQNATAQAKATRLGAAPVSVNVPKFLGGGGGSGGAPKQKPQDRSEEVEFQFEQQLRQVDMSILQAKRQLEGTGEQRAALDVEMIKLEHDIQDAEINHKIAVAQKQFAEGKITKAALDQVTVEAAILKKKNDEKEQIDLQVQAEEEARKKQQAIFDAQDQQRQFAVDRLRTEDQLATTAADHRKIQLEILDAEIEEKRLRLQQNLELAKKNGATAEELKIIQDQIDNLPSERAQGVATINQNTMNPIEQWAHDIPKSRDEILAALQSIEVDGLNGLSQALTDVITGTKSLKDAFHELAASVLQELLQMTIKMLIFKALEAAMGAFGGGGGGSVPTGDLGSDLFGGTVDYGGLPGFATGGSFKIAGIGGTDQNLVSINGMPSFRVSAGERINIANDDMPAGGGGSPIYQTFDLRGAVMTEDLLRQMDEKAAHAADAGAKMGVDRVIDLHQRTHGKIFS